MNCKDARVYVPLLSLPLPGERPEELQSALRHVDDCPDCRAFFETELAEDSRLSRRLLSAPVPDKYADRLLQQVVRRPAVDIIGRSSIQRSWWLTVSALVVLFVICSLLMRWSMSPSTLDAADFMTLLEARTSLAWTGSSLADRPYGWTSVPGLVANPTQQAVMGSIAVHAVTFQFQSARAVEPASGTLWIVESERISDAMMLPDLKGAEIRYGGEQSRLAWAEGGKVYVLVMDAEGLRRLQTALIKSRSIA